VHAPFWFSVTALAWMETPALTPNLATSWTREFDQQLAIIVSNARRGISHSWKQ